MPQLLSPQAATTEAPVPRACAPQQEKPLQWETQHALQVEKGPCSLQLEKACEQQQRPSTTKKKKKIIHTFRQLPYTTALHIVDILDSN